MTVPASGRHAARAAPAIRLLSAAEVAGLVETLADVLIDCVDDGASVSFMAPLARAKAEAFWRRVAEDVARGDRLVVIAEELATGTVLGTAQLVLDQPENQPHRADVSKVLVRRQARKRGIGTALMTAVEAAAQAAGKSLLVLDTASAEAERLYQRSGWIRVGVVPGYALLPDGSPCDTTYYYKRLG